MKDTVLYLECSSGISGDMTVAALLDLGADEARLRAALGRLPLSGYEVRIGRVMKSGIEACDFEVVLDVDNHDHDMVYLHGQDHSGHDHWHAEGDHDHSHTENDRDHGHAENIHDHSHADADRARGQYHTDHSVHEHSHTHDQEGHQHPHDHHSHPHMHRGLKEIQEIIKAAGLTARAQKTALRIFEIIAEAEAKAHGLPVSQVHFHEVGAVDSIVDIVSVAVCLDDLDIETAVIPFLCEGRGTVRCQHGILPVPVPAVANICAAHSLPVHLTAVQGELVTPTGAAIAAALSGGDTLPESFIIRRTGIGAGKRNYECPGILRAHLISPVHDQTDHPHRDQTDCPGCDQIDCSCQGQNDSLSDSDIVKLETNIDDCSGEALGFLMEELLKEGARDAFCTPVYMKKNRPGCLLSVLCDEKLVPALEELIFLHTTTIGIRRSRMGRTVLQRKTEEFNTSLGRATGKVCVKPGSQSPSCYPEYESVRKICTETGRSFEQVYHQLRTEMEEGCHGDGPFDNF